MYILSESTIAAYTAHMYDHCPDIKYSVATIISQLSSDFAHPFFLCFLRDNIAVCICIRAASPALQQSLKLIAETKICIQALRAQHSKRARGYRVVFLNFAVAQESIPPAYVAWRAGTTTLFQLDSQPHRSTPPQSIINSSVSIYKICTVAGTGNTADPSYIFSKQCQLQV